MFNETSILISNNLLHNFYEGLLIQKTKYWRMVR